MTTRPWILYSILRIGIFVVVLTALLLVGIEPWLSAIIAAVVGLCVTYIFFRAPRDAVARSLYEFRTTSRRDADSDAENDALDGRDGMPADGSRADRSEGESRREP